jgi:hypothetical protein
MASKSVKTNIQVTVSTLRMVATMIIRDFSQLLVKFEQNDALLTGSFRFKVGIRNQAGHDGRLTGLDQS